MTRGARRLTTVIALALVPALLAVPSQAETIEPEATPTAVETTPAEEVETTPPAESEAEPEPTADPTSEAPEPTSEPTAAPAPQLTAKKAAAAPAPAPAAKPKAAAAKLPSTWVSLKFNSGSDKKIYTRERFWLRGQVFTTKGKPQANVKVKIFRDTKNGRTRVATVRTSKSGWFVWSPKNRQSGKYRAVVSGTRYSPKITVTRGFGTRTLASREASLSFLIGAPRGGVKRVTSNLVWRQYAKGMLVQYGNRTWLVKGHFAKRFRAHGGAAGQLGAPTGDVRCGLPENACLQQFRTGAIYRNTKAKKKLTSAVAPVLGAADLLAVAKSQVGYREPRPRQSKYNKWIGRTGPRDPWCGFFVSWLAHAAGKPGAVLKKKSYPALLSAEKKRGRTSTTARVGRLAYVGYFSKGSPSHVGIVHKVSGDHVWLIEGNVSSGGGMAHPRGVHVVKRHKSNIVFYADPKY